VTVLFYQRRTQYAPCQIYRRLGEGGDLSPHPNVLPVIQVSEILFPFCTMSPWMPDGNIIQYTRANSGADRLMLVCAHQPEDR